MSAEWTGEPPDPSLGPPQPRYGNPLKDGAEILMGTIAALRQTQVKLEVHGRVLVLRDGDEVYAVGLVDNAD
jgi:hypothetical protein